MPARLSRCAPQLQVSAVARPRNHSYLDHEVASIWRPLAVSSCTQHPGQIALQRDLEALAIALEQDRFDQRSDGLSRARAALFALQRQAEAADLLAIDVGHAWMQQLRHLRRIES
jgi:hypothetical protein